MNNRDNDEPFLARWARRKQSATRGETERAVGPQEKGDAAASSLDADQPAADGTATPEEPPFDLSKLPKIEDLTAETDIAAFLDKRVPAALRNAALGRMWSLDPTIRDFIEVAEYQWNWNVPGGAPFYELMEPGTGASTILADATSAIVRPLNAATDDAQTSPSIISEKEKENIQIEDEQHTQHAALPSNDASTPDADPANDCGTMPDIAAQNSDAALQHIDAEDAFPPRRRHGSALPS